MGVRGGIIPEPDKKPNSTNKQKQNLQALYQLLISPIASQLPKNPDERVIFVPHESLFLIPFPALQDKDGKYLIEKHIN
jgi:CHAT domain-containing protein